jgi:hypothetical protein
LILLENSAPFLQPFFRKPDIISSFRIKESCKSKQKKTNPWSFGTNPRILMVPTPCDALIEFWNRYNGSDDFPMIRCLYFGERNPVNMPPEARNEKPHFPYLREIFFAVTLCRACDGRFIFPGSFHTPPTTDR